MGGSTFFMQIQRGRRLRGRKPKWYFCAAVRVLYPKASSPTSQRQEMIALPAFAVGLL